MPFTISKFLEIADTDKVLKIWAKCKGGYPCKLPDGLKSGDKFELFGNQAFQQLNLMCQLVIIC